MGDDGVLRLTPLSGKAHTLEHARGNIAAARDTSIASNQLFSSEVESLEWLQGFRA
jgi:hypothetical protein